VAGEPEKDLRLPPDIVFDKASGSPGAVVFRHTTHAALTDNKCLTCHPRPFAILHPTRRVRHDDMNAGRSCGLCHDGKSASGTTDSSSCQECHAGPQTAAPKDGADRERPRASEGSRP
jgi:c(7)-type cytochrome triheme protein